MEQAAAKAGVKLAISPLPWRRCLNSVEDKSMDGAIAASFNQERAAFAAYPMSGDKLDIGRRLHTEEYSLYQAKGGKLDWNGSKFTHLNGSVGAQRGYSIINDLKKAGAKVDEGGALPRDNMRKILGGQVQAVGLTTQEGDALMSHPDFVGKIDKIPTPLIQKHYFTIINKDYYGKNQKTIDNLWAAMTTVRESNAYKAQVASAFKSK
jgi:polar amino acid transport system substrate-binding protein